MKVIHWTNAEVSKNPHGVDARKLWDTPHVQVVHICLEPGERLRRHITPVDVFFFVLEGTGVVEVGDEKRECGPGTLIESPADIVHCWYNEGDVRLRVLVVKTPRPERPTRLL
jgi:quercetin dioxygenase-like cupin family protein